jgi:hypothetical protein
MGGRRPTKCTLDAAVVHASPSIMEEATAPPGPGSASRRVAKTASPSRRLHPEQGRVGRQEVCWEEVSITVLAFCPMTVKGRWRTRADASK